MIFSLMIKSNRYSIALVIIVFLKIDSFENNPHN